MWCCQSRRVELCPDAVFESRGNTKFAAEQQHSPGLKGLALVAVLRKESQRRNKFGSRTNEVWHLMNYGNSPENSVKPLVSLLKTETVDFFMFFFLDEKSIQVNSILCSNRPLVLSLGPSSSLRLKEVAFPTSRLLSSLAKMPQVPVGKKMV